MMFWVARLMLGDIVMTSAVTRRQVLTNHSWVSSWLTNHSPGSPGKYLSDHVAEPLPWNTSGVLCSSFSRHQSGQATAGWRHGVWFWYVDQQGGRKPGGDSLAPGWIILAGSSWQGHIFSTRISMLHCFHKRALSFWFPMAGATVENGCMCFIPGSHKQGLRAHRPVSEG